MVAHGVGVAERHGPVMAVRIEGVEWHNTRTSERLKDWRLVNVMMDSSSRRTSSRLTGRSAPTWSSGPMANGQARRPG